jgi:hypothetical protein
LSKFKKVSIDEPEKVIAVVLIVGGKVTVWGTIVTSLDVHVESNPSGAM